MKALGIFLEFLTAHRTVHFCEIRMFLTDDSAVKKCLPDVRLVSVISDLHPLIRPRKFSNIRACIHLGGAVSPASA